MGEQSMVERVARAICESLESDDFDRLDDRSIVKAGYLQQAKAAIEAMREASVYMKGRGSDALDIRPSEAYKVWQFMIDAALKEQEKVGS